MNMKKISASIASVSLVSGLALANDVSLYVGAEAGYGKQSYSEDMKKKLTGNGLFTTVSASAKKKAANLSLILGAKFHENFGAEIGYTFFTKTKALEGKDRVGAVDRTYKATVKNNNMFIDAVGFLPVADCVNVLGSLGLGRLQSKATYETSIPGRDIPAFKKSKTSLRVGLGAEYNFEPVAVRAMLRHQRAGKTAVVKSITTVGVGAVVTVM
jgi:opacity protein-like surface antigen